MYKVYGKDGWEDVHIENFGEQKKAFLSGGDSILATPYLPNLVKFFPAGLHPDLSKDINQATHPTSCAMSTDHSVWTYGRRICVDL